MTSGKEPIVVLAGRRMDIEQAPMLRRALHAAINRPGRPAEVVIDLAKLSFRDSMGLNASCTPGTSRLTPAAAPVNTAPRGA
ncbi:STAS domain-containing protein [Streptomyces xanthophaeus]